MNNSAFHVAESYTPFSKLPTTVTFPEPLEFSVINHISGGQRESAGRYRGRRVTERCHWWPFGGF